MSDCATMPAPRRRSLSTRRRGRVHGYAAVVALTLIGFVCAASPPAHASARAAAHTDRHGPAHHSRRTTHKRSGPRAHAAVIDGTTAAAGSFPWLAFVANVQASTACSGTVISPMVVLTAAHCAEDITTGTVYSPSVFRVVTGTVDWSATSGAQVLPVTAVDVDPSFDPASLDTDVALLILASPTKAPALTLATPADDALLSQGTTVTVAGWGDTYSSEPAAPTLLHWGSSVVQGQTFCSNEEYIDGVPFDPTGAICALDAPAMAIATCHGDSGGPLLATDANGNPIEIGITSRGDPLCNPDFPSVFTRADVISGWAQSVVAANPAPSPPPSPAAAPVTQAAAATTTPSSKKSGSKGLPQPGTTYSAQTSAHGDDVAVSTAAAGKRAHLRITFALACPRRREYSTTIAVTPITAGTGRWRFRASGVDSRHWRYSISASFRAPATIAGTFRVTTRNMHCGTGLVSWSAHATSAPRSGALRDLGRPVGLDIRLRTANNAAAAGIQSVEAQSTTETGDDRHQLSNTTQLRRSQQQQQ